MIAAEEERQFKKKALKEEEDYFVMTLKYVLIIWNIMLL